jgi:hypothetical protein
MTCLAENAVYAGGIEPSTGRRLLKLKARKIYKNKEDNLDLDLPGMCSHGQILERRGYNDSPHSSSELTSSDMDP